MSRGKRSKERKRIEPKEEGRERLAGIYERFLACNLDYCQTQRIKLAPQVLFLEVGINVGVGLFILKLFFSGYLLIVS